ncbi:PEP-CTERM sorting domain-containing protein [Rhodospirillaceae bacterium SYSU D60014]|uniref:PEP-CTERM sorting domain-containing protein n=1 Tax=Virgifigura deserti TaxID=2268457 RepID=UPI0013C4C213
MNIVKLGLAAVAATFIAGTAQAGTIVYDDLSDYVVNPGVNSSGNAIGGERGDATNMFDGDSSTFYSVGFGGSVSLTANPNHYKLTSGTVIEITFPGNGSHREALFVQLGLTDSEGNLVGPLTDVGYFLNQAANNQANGIDAPGVFNLVDASIAELLATPVAGSDGGFFEILINSGTFNTIVFSDASGDLFGSDAYPGQGGTRNSIDGFDIGELRVTAVPEPGTLALLGAGLASLGFFGRRRKAA